MNQLPPGLAGFVAGQQQAQQQDMGQLQQAAQALQIQGAAQQQRERAAAAQRDAAYRAALAGLDPNATADQFVRTAAPFVDAKTLFETHQKSLDREAARSNRPDNRPEFIRLIEMEAGLPDSDPRKKPIQQRIGLLTTRTDPRVRTSQLGLLVQELNDLKAQNPNDPLIKVYEQAITKYQPGGIQVNVNPNDPLIPGKPAQNKIDEGLLDSGMRQQQLSSIERQFRPEFQQLGTRWNALTLSVKDKVGLTDLDPGQKQFLTDFSQYKRNSIDALNQYIKSVTGAAMTNAEAERILRGLPNPGTGLFDGDSPTEFKAKLDDALKQTRLAEARLVYIKRNGMNLADVELSRMPRLMNERGAAIEGAIRKQQPNLPEADVRKLVRRNLAQEFGLVE